MKDDIARNLDLKCDRCSKLGTQVILKSLDESIFCNECLIIIFDNTIQNLKNENSSLRLLLESQKKAYEEYLVKQNKILLEGGEN